MKKTLLLIMVAIATIAHSQPVPGFRNETRLKRNFLDSIALSEYLNGIGLGKVLTTDALGKVILVPQTGGGGGGDIDQTGGKYGTILNGDSANPLSGLGVFRGIGVAKQTADGYFYNGLTDFSSFGNPSDSVIALIGFVHFADPDRSTMIQVSKTQLDFTADSTLRFRFNSGGRMVFDGIPLNNSAQYALRIGNDGTIYKADTSGSGGGGGSFISAIKDTIIYVTDTIAIQNSFTSPIQLLPAISGKAYNPISCSVYMTYNGNAYDFTMNQLAIGQNSNSWFNNSFLTPEQTSNRWYSSGPVGTNIQLLSNTPVYLFAGISNATVGKSTFKVHLLYTLEQL